MQDPEDYYTYHDSEDFYSDGELDGNGVVQDEEESADFYPLISVPEDYFE